MLNPLGFWKNAEDFKEHFLLDLPDAGKVLGNEEVLEKADIHTQWVLIPFLISGRTQSFTKRERERDSQK